MADKEKDSTSETPLEVSIYDRLAWPVYRTHRELWEKANDRLLQGDPDGAITAARALLEMTSKHVLDKLNLSYSESVELPKLYNEVCRALGMAPGSQVEPSMRAVFSSTFTVVQSVAELRSKYGDAHGKTARSPRASRADAELAVHLAGAVTCYLVSRLESHLSATLRLTQDGKAILWFDKTIVWRLVDHATNSPKVKLFYGKDVGRCLILVGDAGIYLVSNGDPPIYDDGTLVRQESEEHKLLLIAPAEGCDAFADVDDWWPIHNAIDGGNDFSLPIPVDEVRRALYMADLSIVVVADSEQYRVVSDVEFDRQQSAGGGALRSE